MRGWRPAPDTEISISKSRDVRRFNMELSRNGCEATAGLAIPYYYCSFSFQPFTTLVYKISLLDPKTHHTMKIPSVLAGVAGEYFVAAELSRRGYIASVTLRNTRGIDILATNQDATKSITIQCKTRQKKGKTWILNEKSEDFYSDSHFYVFVALGVESERPCYHIVPSREVAKHTKKTHSNWLGRPRLDGKKHVDNHIRNFTDSANKYLEKWELLGLQDD